MPLRPKYTGLLGLPTQFFSKVKFLIFKGLIGLLEIPKPSPQKTYESRMLEHSLELSFLIKVFY